MSSSLASALDSSSSLTSRSHQKALRLSAPFPMAVEPCYLRRKSSSNTAQSKLKKEKLSWTSQRDWFEEARALSNRFVINQGYDFEKQL